MARSFERGGSSAVDAARQALAVVYREVERQATQLAYLDTLRLLAIAAVCMLPLLVLVRAPAGRRAAR